MEKQANPSISMRPVQQIVDPNDFGISLRPVQQIIDPNDFTLFGNTEYCSLDQNVTKLQHKVEVDTLELTTTVDVDISTSSVEFIEETEQSDLLTPGKTVPSKPSEVINNDNGIEKSDALVSVGKNQFAKNHRSDLINTPNKEPNNVALVSESLETLGGEVTGDQSTTKPTNSISTDNLLSTPSLICGRLLPQASSCDRLLPPPSNFDRLLPPPLICDRLLPPPLTPIGEQTKHVASTRTVLDAIKQTTNPPDDLTNSPRGVLTSSYTLHPPKSGCSHPVTQEKPAGCKTVWVGGLPASATEEMVREIFQRFGKIVDLRREKMCYHVRFERASAVNLAVSLSGYRLVVGGSRDPSHSGLLFVDYVKSKEDKLGSTSSTPVCCTDSDITKAIEMIKRDDRFLEALQLLSRWLEMEDYDKKNSDKIYSMIQESNAHAIRLQTEKKRQYEEMKRSRNQCRGKAEVISSQISHIERLFAITSQKKVLDHFTDTQKASLNLWKTEFLKYQEQIENLSTEVDDLALLGADKEREVKKSEVKEKETVIENSDNLRTQIVISALKTKHKTELASKNEEIQKLKGSLESLKKDLENAEELRIKGENKIAYLYRKKGDSISQGPTKGYNVLEQKLKDDLRNERRLVISLQTEISELKRWLADADYNDKQLAKQMSDNEREYQHSLAVLKERLYDREVELKETKRRIWEKNQAETPATKTLYNEVSNQRAEIARLTRLRVEDGEKIETLEKELRKKPQVETINVRHARMISLISAFLLIHPCGVGLNFIIQYVQRMEPTASSDYIESVLCKYSSVFVFDLVGRKWMLKTHAQTEPKDKRADKSSSRDASSDNDAGNSSQMKRNLFKTRPPTSRINRPVGTDPNSSVLASEKQQNLPQVGELVGTNHPSGLASPISPEETGEENPLSNLPFQVQPPTSQDGQPIGTSSHSSGLTSQIQPPTSQIQPQSSQIQPHSPQIQHQSPQIQPQSPQIQPQSPQIQPQLSQIQPQSSQIQPQPPQIPTHLPQMQPRFTKAKEQRGGENLELRSNGLSTFGEEIRLTNLLKKFPVSAQWSPQLLRRLQEICVFRNKNSLHLRASKRSSVRVIVPVVSDEQREIYKHTVTIPGKYPEEKWLRRKRKSKDYSLDNISETSVSGYYPFSHKNNVQCSTSLTSATSDGTPLEPGKLAENMPDSAFKCSEEIPRSSQNQTPSRADEEYKNLETEAEEHRLARIVSCLPNHYEWSFALQARLRFYKPRNHPHIKHNFSLRTSDGKKVEVYLPKIKVKKLDKLKAIVFPNKFKEEYMLDAIEERRVIPAIAGNSCLPAGMLETSKRPETDPETYPSRAHSDTLTASLSLESITSSEEAIGLSSPHQKSPGDNSTLEEVTTDNQPSEECRPLQPQIPYRKPSMLVIQQDQQNQSQKKRHCPEDAQEPLAKVTKMSEDVSKSCSGKDAGAKTPLIDESESRKSSKKVQTMSKAEDSLIADDKANTTVKGDAKKISKEENTKRDDETKFTGSGKSDDGESTQKVAKLDITEDKKLEHPSKSSVHSQSNKKNKSSDTEPEGKGLKQDATNARDKIPHDSRKSSRSSKEFKKNRQKTSDSKRTSSTKEESKERELGKHRNIAGNAKNSDRDKDTVIGNIDKLCEDATFKKHRRSKSKDIKTRHRELPKNKDESLSVESGSSNKDAAKKEHDKANVSSDSSKSLLPKQIERNKNLTTDSEAKPSGSSESSNKERCHESSSDKHDPESRAVDHSERPKKELNERLLKLFNSSNESVEMDSQEDCSKQDSTKPKDLGEKSSKDSLVSNNKNISVDASEKSGTQEKSHKGEEFGTAKGSAEDISKAVQNGASSNSSKRPRNISKNEDEGLGKNAEQESGKNFDQKCEDFRKKYLESATKKLGNAPGGKGLENQVSSKKQNESPVVSMTFAQFLSSQQTKGSTDRNGLAEKPETNNKKQMLVDSRSSSEKSRKRCYERDADPVEPGGSSSKSATLDSVPHKRSKPVKPSQLKENLGQITLESQPAKSSKPLEQSQNSEPEKKLFRSPSKPNMIPKIRIKCQEQLRWQNSSKSKKKASVCTNRKSTEAEEQSSRKTTSDSLRVSVEEKTAQGQSKESGNEDPVSLLNQAIHRANSFKETQELRNPSENIKDIECSKGAPLVHQESEPPKIKEEICGPEKVVKEEQLEFQISMDGPKLEEDECTLKENILKTDEADQIYEASSKNAQDLRNELQQLFGDPGEPEDAPESLETLDDYFCDTYWSSEDLHKLSGEGLDMKFVK